jgi:hypothetical protein
MHEQERKIMEDFEKVQEKLKFMEKDLEMARYLKECCVFSLSLLFF